MIRLTPEWLEKVCLGKYATNPKIKAIFWDNFIKVAKETGISKEAEHLKR